MSRIGKKAIEIPSGVKVEQSGQKFKISGPKGTMQMDCSPMIQVKVAHLGLDRATNTPVVILQELEGERVLPIWIGPAEASAIAIHAMPLCVLRALKNTMYVRNTVDISDITGSIQSEPTSTDPSCRVHYAAWPRPS